MSISDSGRPFPPDKLRPIAKLLLYYAAKDGHPITMIYVLNDIKEKRIRNALLNSVYKDDEGQSFTPLGVAASYGRHMVVKTLLKNYKVDIEKECIVKFDGHMVHGATALWCAAGAGHLNIIKLLVAQKANVNHKTKAQSTPLRAACFQGRLDVVRYLVMHGADVQLANAYNNTCLMISAYKGHTDVVEFLLKSGANPNEQALCGATALHYAAECGHVEICDMLLEYGAVLLPNEFGLTPVLTAADKTNEAIVELFSHRPGLLTKKDKIDALELMGASFANDKDNYSTDKAFQYLHLAMQLRYEDTDNVIKKKFNTPLAAYDNWIESQTMQDLQAIRLNHNSIHMESLVIRERILGRKYPDLAQPIVFRGAIYADHSRFDRCESLWLYALELRQANRISVERDLLRFAQLFSQMIHLGLNVRLGSVLAVLSSCIFELQQNRQKIADPKPKDDVRQISEEFEQNVVTTLYILTIITKILKIPTQKFQIDELSTLYKFVYTLNKMIVKLRDGQSLLHLAVNGVTPVDDFHTNDVCRFPCTDTVKLLLHCGANISVTDCDRNTPLHTLTSTFQTARASDNEMISTVEEIADIFMKSGIHLDAVNNDGLTAIQVSPLSIIEGILKKYEVERISLKCLASRSIARHKINYKGAVPTVLEKFVQMHSASKL